MISRDTSRECDALVTQLYRNMATAKKARLLFDAMCKGQQLAMAGLRQLHPEADEQQIWHLWAKQHLGDELYEEVYGDRIK
ncbi:MAG: hypothetical protein OEV87_10680 [Phycisphaerae bacterium]|nr:hypothetical protein [Phycisphaerae bacterium]